MISHLSIKSDGIWSDVIWQCKIVKIGIRMRILGDVYIHFNTGHNQDILRPQEGIWTRTV